MKNLKHIFIKYTSRNDDYRIQLENERLNNEQLQSEIDRLRREYDREFREKERRYQTRERVCFFAIIDVFSFLFRIWRNI